MSPEFGAVPDAGTSLMAGCSSVVGFEIVGGPRINGLAQWCGPLPGGTGMGMRFRSQSAGSLTPLLGADFCANDSSVVGVRGDADGSGIGRFGVTCAVVGARASGSTTVTRMPLRGSTPGTAFDSTCPDRQIVTMVRFVISGGALRTIRFSCTGVVLR